MKELSEFLPKTPKEGYRGFYPCANNEEWSQLPLPMKCITWFQNVHYVVFDAWFDNYKIKANVHVHRENAHKALFCSSQGGTQLYSITGVVFEDGRDTFAKWYQDTRTGTFAIYDGSGSLLGKQGGYKGFIPEICYKDENNNEWKLDFCKNGKNISHVSF